MNTTTTEEEHGDSCCNCMMLLNEAILETRFMGGQTLYPPMCDTAMNIAKTFHRLFNEVKGVSV